MPILATLFFMQGMFRAFRHSRPAKRVQIHKINEV